MKRKTGPNWKDSRVTEQPLTIRQLAELLQVSERTVQRNVHRWPHLKIGPRTIRFTEEHVARIMTMTSIEPVQREQWRRTTGGRRVI